MARLEHERFRPIEDRLEQFAGHHSFPIAAFNQLSGDVLQRSFIGGFSRCAHIESFSPISDQSRIAASNTAPCTTK